MELVKEVGKPKVILVQEDIKLFNIHSKFIPSIIKPRNPSRKRGRANMEIHPSEYLTTDKGRFIKISK